YDTFYQLSDSTGNNIIPVYGVTLGSQITNFSIRSGGVSQTDYVGISQPTTTPFKSVQALTTNDSLLGINGVLTAQDTTVTMPIGINRFSIGSDLFNAKQIQGYIRQLRIYPVRLSNSQLKQLTS
ncbi:hypothetical protein EBR43_08990, partial [bacterium]|nr:hypothetical protein [bacterium]